MIGSKKVDMCEGALLPNLLMFAIPLIASNILQLLFNAADVIVVGRFTGSGALAAVGRINRYKRCCGAFLWG